MYVFSIHHHFYLQDEPTTGMDPKAKRLVWDCLLDGKKNGQAIVLTSHRYLDCFTCHKS